MTKFRTNIVICDIEKNTGIIFELKLRTNGNSKSTLDQILENEYYILYLKRENCQ